MSAMPACTLINRSQTTWFLRHQRPSSRADEQPVISFNASTWLLMPLCVSPIRLAASRPVYPSAISRRTSARRAVMRSNVSRVRSGSTAAAFLSGGGSRASLLGALRLADGYSLRIEAVELNANAPRHRSGSLMLRPPSLTPSHRHLWSGRGRPWFVRAGCSRCRPGTTSLRDGDGEECHERQPCFAA